MPAKWVMWLILDFEADNDAKKEINPKPKTKYLTLKGNIPYKYTILLGYEKP